MTCDQTLSYRRADSRHSVLQGSEASTQRLSQITTSTPTATWRRFADLWNLLAGLVRRHSLTHCPRKDGDFR